MSQVISTKKQYAAYRLRERNTRSSNSVYDPPLDDQIARILAAFERRYGYAPPAYHIGPVTDGYGQTLIKAGEVWCEMQARPRSFATA